MELTPALSMVTILSSSWVQDTNGIEYGAKGMSIQKRITCSDAFILNIANSSNVYKAHIHIKTHGSESRGQEEAGLRDERVSYLQVAPT